MVLDEDVGARNVPTPRHGLDDFETGNVSIGDIESCELGAKYTNAVVPPLLTISVEPPTRF